MKSEMKSALTAYQSEVIANVSDMDHIFKREQLKRERRKRESRGERGIERREQREGEREREGGDSLIWYKVLI